MPKWKRVEMSLNGQELLGAVSPRLVHALSNYASALAGNLMICESTQASAEEKRAALAGIGEAARRSAELLDRFSDLSRTVRAGAGKCSLVELGKNLEEWVRARNRWTLLNSIYGGGAGNLGLAGPWKWVAFCLDTILNESRASEGSIKVQNCEAPRDVRPLNDEPMGYISISITMKSEEGINWHDHREGLRNWNLTAAYELLNQIGTRPETRAVSRGTHVTTMVLPLVAIVV
jgi:hypothetical protein